MVRKWFGLAVFLLFSSCTILPGSQNQATRTSQDTSNLEYAIYSTYIESQYTGEDVRQIVMLATTGNDFSASDVKDRMAYVKEQLPELSADTRADFLAKVDQPVTLKAESFNLSVPVTLISEEERTALFQNTQGNAWEAFYQKYPNSQGIMTLSRVGFNKNLDQALLYVGNQSHYLAGAGFYVLLERTNSGWVIIKSTMSWIS